MDLMNFASYQAHGGYAAFGYHHEHEKAVEEEQSVFSLATKEPGSWSTGY